MKNSRRTQSFHISNLFALMDFEVPPNVSRNFNLLCLAIIVITMLAAFSKAFGEI
jgi:cellobiose-specific phosphotransferase system component IIC